MFKYLNFYRSSRAIIVLLISAVMLLSIVFGLLIGNTGRVSASREEAVAVQNILYNSAGITQAKNFTGKLWAVGFPPYTTRADFFISTTVGAENSVTLTLQVSADNSRWVNAGAIRTDNLSLGVMALGSYYTTTQIVGQYFRMTAAVVTTDLITPVIRVILH